MIDAVDFDLFRISPSQKLQTVIENYWVIEWDLAGKPDYCQKNLPHPSVNLVVDPGETSGIFGVQTGIFTYSLRGKGRLFGAKFWPGAFFDFYGKPVSGLKDRSVPISSVFDAEDGALERAFVNVDDITQMGEVVEDLLLAKNVTLGARAFRARELVEIIASKADLVRLDQLCEVCGLSIRGVQRLFESQVGINPKWIIERYRMLAAVDALNEGTQLNLTHLAHRLGYYDQAHFITRFRALTGRAPSTYKNVKSGL